MSHLALAISGKESTEVRAEDAVTCSPRVKSSFLGARTGAHRREVVTI